MRRGGDHVDIMAMASQMDGFRLDEVTCWISCALRIGGGENGDAQVFAYSPIPCLPSTSSWPAAMVRLASSLDF